MKEAAFADFGKASMFYELIRSLVQKIFQDKILAGLVIVGILAIFVGGFGGNATDRIATGPRDARVHQESASAPAQAQQTGSKADKQANAPVSAINPALAKIDPPLATQFVTWWISSAMDFNPQTAVKHRQEAVAWVSPEAAPAYQAAFWPPEIADGITSGRITGSFTPTAVEAVASNPDGSIVVNVKGNLILQQGNRPAVQQLSTDYLVKRDTGGLRIAGLYNRAVLVPSNSVY
ncbi:MAG: hypothetical protein K2X27_28545 [Candidatus Obscuribacterales bacterium]|nr:hypothetical protein [Candidatus Obscuribacterales bacterium]